MELKKAVVLLAFGVMFVTSAHAQTTSAESGAVAGSESGALASSNTEIVFEAPIMPENQKVEIRQAPDIGIGTVQPTAPCEGGGASGVLSTVEGAVGFAFGGNRKHCRTVETYRVLATSPGFYSTREGQEVLLTYVEDQIPALKKAREKTLAEQKARAGGAE